jgi:hypothetical protein
VESDDSTITITYHLAIERVVFLPIEKSLAIKTWPLIQGDVGSIDKTNTSRIAFERHYSRYLFSPFLTRPLNITTTKLIDGSENTLSTIDNSPH